MMYCWNQTAGSEYPCPTLRPVVRPCNLFTITQVNLTALLRYCITLEKKCPYIWKPELYLFCALRRGKPSSRATPIPHYDGTRPLSVFRVAALLKRFSVRLGLSDILRVHSMRVGFACACMQAGIPLSEIQKLGQWKTDTYLLYVRDSVFRNHIRDGLVQSMVDFHMESV